MSLILAVDDVAPGMFVAVHSSKRPRMIHHRGHQIALDDAIAESSSPVPPGVPLRIIGVSLPFAACAIVQPGGEESGPAIIDLRIVHLSRLNSEFVESIVAFDSDNVDSKAPDDQ